MPFGSRVHGPALTNDVAVNAAIDVSIPGAASAVFEITDAPAMPEINVEARLTRIAAADVLTAATLFKWNAIVTFSASGCLHGPERQIIHPMVMGSALWGKFKIPFTQIRGGHLVVKVSAIVNGQRLEATLDRICNERIRIVGTNPTSEQIAAVATRAIVRQMVRQESGQCQFIANNGRTGACPLFSADNLGGVGLLQITNPAPTDDEVWSWRANLDRGIQMFEHNLTIACRYPATVRAGQAFKNLVTQFGHARIAAKLPALTVTLPDFTDEQAEQDACRGFNGWAGHDGFSFHLHEFRVPLDAQGRLVVPNDGVIVWERVPAADRPQGIGDPNYVKHVLARARH